MSIRYILGRSGTGKTSFIYNDIKEKLKNKKDIPLILIVPEQFNFQAHKDLISILDTKGIMNVEILSFQRLAHRVFEEVGKPKEKFLGDLGRNMVIRKVIDQMEEELQILNKSARQPGFIKNLGSMISEFQQYDIIPETLLEKKEIIKSPILEAKINDLYLVFKRFKNYMKEKYITSEEILDVLTYKIEESFFLDGANIWIDGFYGFTPQQYRILYKLLQKVEIVNISLTLDPEVDLFSPYDETDPFCESRKTFDKLNKITALYNIKVEEIVKLKQGKNKGKNPELINLEKQFFNYPCIPYKKETQNIKLYTASNPYGEIEQVAKEILELVKNKQYRYRDIAVVTGDISKYQKIIEGIFKEYNIAYFIDVKRDILSHPLIELIRSSLEIIINNWSYESIFRYLKTGFTQIKEEDIDLLENYVLAYGIKGKKRWTGEDWEKKGIDELEDIIQKEYEENNLKKINETRKKVAIPLSKFNNKIRNNKKYSVKDITIAIYELMEDLQINKKLLEFIDKFKEENQLILVKQNLQIWDLIVELFEKMVEILGEEQLTIREYSKILDAGLEQCKMGLVPPALDQVVIGDLERSRLPNIKALFVIGVNDGILPAVPEDLGLFSDEERRFMDQIGLELAPDGRRRAFEEQFLIYSGLTKPSQYLHISFCMGDEEGKALRPSILIQRIKTLFPKIKESSDLQNTNIEEMISSPINTFHYLGQALRDIIENGELKDIWKDVYSWYLSNENWSEKTKITVRGLFHTNQENYIKKESVKKLYKNKIYSSVSRLEKFAACPFGYFVEYGLKAKERKFYQLQTPDIGRLFHSVLDVFSKKLKGKGISWKDLDRNLSEILIDEIVEELAPKLGNEILFSSARNKYLIRRLKRITKRAVWALTEHIKRGNFEPLGFEIGFGEEYKLPPIVIELSTGEKIILTGRIDRVDILDKDNKVYIKIIDYKSGNKSFNLADIFYGIQLQLLLYLDAFIKQGRKIFNDKELLPGGVFYFKIDDPIIREAKEMTQEEIEKLLLKDLKLSGMVLKDIDIIRQMDNQINRYSDIIPVQLTKNGISKNSSVATLEEFNALREFVKNIVVEIGEEILKGNIKISPYKIKEDTSCKYCLYQSICQFDTLLENNKYRILKNLNKEKIWEQLKEDTKK
ncbi:helicase-exonuclease AddAB subunit AddB [Defluviitalea phaphyphila]|uniref:helicase-exonuclease AddAB subunit AddB n=1 Tax=Defluviitalea phaphyphila TaxID=1473580 RepID=UPI000730DED8|nr:helicase-exonuclease AddAB subunit AddB [Defluviitalea phaphyphila]